MTDRERVAEAIYLGLYEDKGGRWECVENRDREDPWCKVADRVLSALDRPEAQDGVATAARVLLAEHERCSAIPIGKRTHAEHCAAQMGRNRLRALSQGGK